MNKFTEGCTKIGNVYRLYEDVSITKASIIEKVKVEKLTESINGQELPIYGTYTIKIWNVDPNDRNKNGRNYSKIAQKVLKENKITVGLMNHPDKGLGDPKDIFAVEKNPRIIENWLCVDITFVGEHGAKCAAILEAGGPLEFSSSCLGDVDYNGYVIEEGFDVERWADRVFGPSNGLSLFIENDKIKEDEAKMLHEEDNKKELEDNNKLEETLTIINKDNGEKRMSDKLLETTLTININGMIKEAAKTESFSERKAILENALLASEELTNKSLKETIEKEIVKVNEEIHALAEKGKAVPALEGNVQTLTESIEAVKKEKIEEVAKVTSELEAVKKEKEELEATHKTLVEMYENKEYEAGQKVVDINKSLSKTVSILRNRINKLSEKVNYFEALSNTKVDADVVIALKETNNKLAKKTQILERSLTEKETKVNKEEFRNSEVEEYFNSLVEKDSSIEKAKNRFINCSSLREAQVIRMNLDDSIPVRSKEERSSSRLNTIRETDKNKDDKKEKVSALEKVLNDRGLI